VNGDSRILVAGLGNIFLGDDGFGVAVAGRLLAHPPPGDVSVMDAGIRGVHLAYTMLEGYDLVILVDAVSRGGTAGTIYVIEPEAPADGADDSSPVIDAHDLDPAKVLRLVAAMGGSVGRVLLVGCEAGSLNEAGDLSEPVRDAVGRAVDLVETLVHAEQKRGRAPVQAAV
jgi:hydrogenase maturation protease